MRNLLRYIAVIAALLFASVSAFAANVYIKNQYGYAWGTNVSDLVGSSTWTGTKIERLIFGASYTDGTSSGIDKSITIDNGSYQENGVAGGPTKCTITVTATPLLTIKNSVSVTVNGNDQTKTLTFTASSKCTSIFNVDAGSTLTIGSNVIITNDNNSGYGVSLAGTLRIGNSTALKVNMTGSNALIYKDAALASGTSITVSAAATYIGHVLLKSGNQTVSSADASFFKLSNTNDYEIAVVSVDGKNALVIRERVKFAIRIVRAGLATGESAVYKVYDTSTSPNTLVHTVTITGNGTSPVSRTVRVSNPGPYRVEESGWDWTYNKSQRSLNVTAVEASTVTAEFAAAGKKSNLPGNVERVRTF